MNIVEIMLMNTHRLSVLFALGGLLAIFTTPATATYLLTIPGSSFGFQTQQITDTGSASTGSGPTVINNKNLGSSLVNQFNPSSGVLLGATVNLQSDLGILVKTSSTNGQNTGPDEVRTTNGTGQAIVNITAPGLSSSAVGAVVGSDSCTGIRTTFCSGMDTLFRFDDGSEIFGATWTSRVINDHFSIGAASLNNYVGPNQTAISHSLVQLTALQQNNVFTGVESTLVWAEWTGNVTVTYEYLLHAKPSFDDGSLTLNLDFGDVHQGAAQGLSFSILNGLAGSSGPYTRLELNGIVGSGDTSILTTNILDSLWLGGGGNFLASIDTSGMGDFDATYVLTLSDDSNIGASSSRHSGYALTLNLSGSVVPVEEQEQVNNIPEPDSLFMLGIGLLCLVGSQRRR